MPIRPIRDDRRFSNEDGDHNRRNELLFKAVNDTITALNATTAGRARLLIPVGFASLTAGAQSAALTWPTALSTPPVLARAWPTANPNGVGLTCWVSGATASGGTLNVVASAAAANGASFLVEVEG